MPALNTGRQNPAATPGGWVSGSQDDPIETPDIPPLWGDDWPSGPPILDTQPTPLDPPPPTSAFGGQTRSVSPNDRNPVTGAPVWNAAKPPGPLPPGRTSVTANGQMPVTGAPIFVPPSPHTMNVPQIGTGWGDRPVAVMAEHEPRMTRPTS